MKVRNYNMREVKVNEIRFKVKTKRRFELKVAGLRTLKKVKKSIE